MSFKLLHVLASIVKVVYFDCTRLVAYCHQLERETDCIIDGEVLPAANLVVYVQSFQALSLVGWQSINISLICVP